MMICLKDPQVVHISIQLSFASFAAFLSMNEIMNVTNKIRLTIQDDAIQVILIWQRDKASLTFIQQFGLCKHYSKKKLVIFLLRYLYMYVTYNLLFKPPNNYTVYDI